MKIVMVLQPLCFDRTRLLHWAIAQIDMSAQDMYLLQADQLSCHNPASHLIDEEQAIGKYSVHAMPTRHYSCVDDGGF